jgi:transcriptional regulator with PAS, ATPase and Fis domain
MKGIVALAKKVGPTDVPVLIAGETGAGKEVVAELIHANSDRRSRQMVCINCAGLPAELIESELFGSSRGSFTSSIDRIGMFKHADRSTAFLDELSEMPLALQAKLLRFLQDKRVRRVGAIGEETVDVRIIAAVNKLPGECVKLKRLREDLFYRLGTVTIIVPPLRDRPQDILPLANAYLQFYSTQFKRPPPVFDANVQNTLMSYDWPGNVRQLQNEMNRCALLCNGSVSVKDLNIQPEITGEGDLQDCLSIPVSELTQLERAEARAIIKMLVECKWNKLEASAKLGIGRQTLYNKVKTFGIKTPTNDARLAERTLLHSEPSARKPAPAPSPSPAPAPERIVVQSTGSSSGVSAAQSGEGFLD